MKVKNTSDSSQSVTGIPTFEAGEVRDVNNEQSEILLRNPHFEKETASEKRRKGAFPKKAEPDTKKVTV